MVCCVVFPKVHLSFYKFNVYQATESDSKRVRWRLAPTRREQDKWNRAAKAATDGSVSNFVYITLNLCHLYLISNLLDILFSLYKCIT